MAENYLLYNAPVIIWGVKLSVLHIIVCRKLERVGEAIDTPESLTKNKN